MNSLNVLLVTYSFPPVGGVGVLRAASLARYFPDERIRLDVITARNPSTVGADSRLLNDIPSGVRVHRTITVDLPFGIKKGIKRLITEVKLPSGGAGPTAGGSQSVLKRLLGDVLLPDPQVTWLPVLSRVARRIIEERHIDLVLITAPPFSNILLVEKLRKRFSSLPIVIDFRDEWLSTAMCNVGFLFSRSERARNFARNVEARAVANATSVVAVTEAARCEIRARYPEEPDHKFQLIPNGFDATRTPRYIPDVLPRQEDKIVITYLGSIYNSTEPSTLVEALQSLPVHVKSLLRIRFIGHIEETRYRRALLQLGEMVELKGFLPQDRALAAMMEADYSLLITHDPINVSAKFYDYIGAGKPILACVHPQGDVRRLLEELRAGWWAGSRDVEGIRRLFMDVATRGKSMLTNFHPDVEKIAKYERKALARSYAELLQSIHSPNDRLASNADSGVLVEPVRMP